MIMSSTFTVTQLFRPGRSGSGRTGRNRTKQQMRTWTGQFFCLSDTNATKTPSASEKISLQGAGLGLKKIQFRLDDSEEEVFKILSEEKGFPKLHNIGGFELLHCSSNCRELQRLNCKWNVESLQKLIGSQAKIYIRPIQNNITITQRSDPVATSLQGECKKCNKKFLLSELREHVNVCDKPSSVDNDVIDEQVQPVSPSQNSTIEYLEDESRPSSPVFENVDEIEDINVADNTSDETSIEETVDAIVSVCKENNITDPIDILRICQKKIVQGRKLDIVDESEVLTGGTNYIMVDREDVLKSSMEEIRDIDNLRKCLEVQFYGETAVDFGGPRKEFFGIAVRDMKEQYFDNVKERSPDYEVLGKIMAVVFNSSPDIILVPNAVESDIQYDLTAKGTKGQCLMTSKEKLIQTFMETQVSSFLRPSADVKSKIISSAYRRQALSLLQNGKLPKVLSSDLVEEVFKSNSSRPFVKDLRQGLDSLGVYQLALKLPMLVHLFTPGAQRPMTFKFLTSILQPQFSPEGSNRRKRESAIYSLFVKYIREAASGRRGMVDLQSILRFATGTEEEPALGFSISPTIHFVEGTSFMPTANTCINKMNLTMPDSHEVSVGKDFLFNLFDYAFCNTYFGMK